MKCSKCQFENLPDASLCESCGQVLVPDISEPGSESDNTDMDIIEANVEQTDGKPVFLPVDKTVLVDPTDNQNANELSNSSSPVLPDKKKAAVPFKVIMAAIIIAVTLIAVLGFVFRYKFLKIISPEKYLQVSLGRTFSDKNLAGIIDTGKYENKPIKQEISAEMDGVGGELSVLYDAKGEKALFEAMIQPDGAKKYDDNLLYISREVIAVSIPDVVTEAEFLTIDPETLDEDFEELGIEESFTSENINQALDMFFGKNPKDKMNVEETKEYYRQAKFLEEYADFSQGETVREKIGGKTYKLDTMCYEISEKDANRYLHDMLDSYKQTVMDKMGGIYQGYEWNSVQDRMDSAFDVFDDIRINGDIKMTFYIDKNDYVRKILIDDFELALPNEEEKIAIEYEMLLGGNKNPTDDISALVTLGVNGQEAEMEMNWEESFESGVFQGELEWIFRDNQDSGDTSVTIELEWDTKDKKGENFSAELSFDNMDDAVIKVTGALSDNKKSTTFTDGELMLIGDNSVLIDFEYSIAIIDPKEISVDLTDSMSLMEYAEQEGLLSSESDD